MTRSPAAVVAASLLLLALPASAYYPQKVQKGFDKCIAKGTAKRACKKAAYADYMARCGKFGQPEVTCEAGARHAGWAVDPRWKPAAFDAAVAALGAAESYRGEGDTNVLVEVPVQGSECLTFRLDAPGKALLHGQVAGDGLWVAEMSGSRFESAGPNDPFEVCFDHPGTATLSVVALHPEHRMVQAGRALQVAVGVDRRPESPAEASKRQAEQTASIERQLAERAARAAAARKQAIARDRSEYGLLVAMACEMCREERDTCLAQGAGGCGGAYEQCAAFVGVDTFGIPVCARD